MTRRERLLEKMRANPKADWRIEDVETLCRQVGLTLSPPSGGSHYMVTSPHAAGGLPVPFARPIKPIYIKKLVSLADAHSMKENGIARHDVPSGLLEEKGTDR